MPSKSGASCRPQVLPIWCSTRRQGIPDSLCNHRVLTIELMPTNPLRCIRLSALSAASVSISVEKKPDITAVPCTQAFPCILAQINNQGETVAYCTYVELGAESKVNTGLSSDWSSVTVDLPPTSLSWKVCHRFRSSSVAKLNSCFSSARVNGSLTAESVNISPCDGKMRQHVHAECIDWLVCGGMRPHVRERMKTQ